MGSEDAAPQEAQLLQRIAQGDREAFAVLYDRYSKPLYSFAVRILSDPKEAEDVLQDVFLQIWGKAAEFDEAAGKPFSWAVTMTRNKAIDRLRARKSRLRLFEEAVEGAAAEQVTADPTDAGGLVRDEAARIRTAVNTLPEDQRRPIELAFFNGLTHPEIAETLKEPLGTIKARIRRGMLRLRDGLKGLT